MSTSYCVKCGNITEDICLVLGDQWLDFCTPCAETETVTNSETGEIKTVIELVNDGSTKKKETDMNTKSVVKNVIGGMVENRKYQTGQKESTAFLSLISKLPLMKKIKDALSKHIAMIYIERTPQGGDTFETSCCIEQGAGGFGAVIPIPTHRVMMLSNTDSGGHGEPTATFRYMSKMGLEDILKDSDLIEFEWKDQLPCFPKAMIVAEIDGNLGAGWCYTEAVRKGLGENPPVPIPFPDTYGFDDDDLWLMA